MTAPFARYKNAVAICNRSGWKMYRADMVEDGYLKGLLVHPEWYDPPQPQEEPFDPEEGIAIWKPAPDLIPPPLPPVVSIAGNVLTWTQPDSPSTTLLYWQVWRNVPNPPRLLLRADGTNGSTAFTDSSLTKAPMTAAGAAVIDTAGPKFGTGSLSRPGNSSANLDAVYTPITSGSQLDVMSRVGGVDPDFTIDMWWKPSGVAEVLMDYYGDRASFGGTQNLVLVGSPGAGNGSLQLICNKPGFWGLIGSSFLTVTAGTWYHVAVQRKTVTGVSTMTLYLNGVVVATQVGQCTNYSFTAPAYATFGWSATQSGGLGACHLDDIRVSASALYTGAFTPPTQAAANPTPTGALLLAQVNPTTPIDYFIQGPDRIAGDPTNSAIGGATYTDGAGIAGYQYYVVAVTADGGTEGLPGLNSPASNIVTHA